MTISGRHPARTGERSRRGEVVEVWSIVERRPLWRREMQDSVILDVDASSEHVSIVTNGSPAVLVIDERGNTIHRSGSRTVTAMVGETPAGRSWLLEHRSDATLELRWFSPDAERVR